MEVRSVLQVAGENDVASLLLDCLVDARYTRFRFMTAFVRWAGLSLLHPQLREFADRPGADVTGFVGIDLGGTTVEALTYLSELPNSTIKIVKSNQDSVVFHPKIYEFSGAAGSLTVVGSSNMTMGGLLSNVEASLVLVGDPSEDLPCDGLFAQLDGPPFTPAHVRLVTARVLDELAPVLDGYTRRAPDTRKDRATGEDELRPDLVFPKPGRPPAKTTSASGRRPAGARDGAGLAQPSRARESLIVELWDETRGGTQVQLPKQAFEDFFGADGESVVWVTIRHERETYRIRLQAFSNSTFRISLPFLPLGRQSPRRAVLRFDRIGQDTYTCSVAYLGQREYRRWLSACDRQTTAVSKKWTVLPTWQAPTRATSSRRV